MSMQLLGNELKTTYFVNWERGHGIPWCLVVGETWHILLPHWPHGPWPSILHARPVLSDSELDAPLPDGVKTRRLRRWRWRLELGAWHLPLGAHRMFPSIPPLIQWNTKYERRAVCYCSPKGDGDFARVARRLPLLMVRDAHGQLPHPWVQAEKRRHARRC